MINVSTITAQIKSWLESDTELAGVIVQRGEPVNNDPGQAVNGWVGIYRRTLDYDPRNLGTAPNNYDADLDIVVIVQKTSMRSGADCEDKLEDLIKRVLDRVVQIPRTYIDTFTDILIEYTYLETDRKTMFFQGALIQFTAAVSFEVE